MLHWARANGCPDYSTPVRLEWADGQPVRYSLGGTLAGFGPRTWTPVRFVPMVLAQPDTGVVVAGMTASAYSGKLVLIKRGSPSPFTSKVKNAQDHGAVAVVVYNNVEGACGAMAGTDASITIPSMYITKSDGEMLRDLINGAVHSADGFIVTMKPGTE